MSTADDPPPTLLDEDSRSRGLKPAKEKKRRRRSRSKQKETATPDSQGLEQELIGLEDDGENSCSSTPKYERPEEPLYPSGGMQCALCYCGEKSLLGQGDLTRYSPSPGFNPFKKPPLRTRGSRELLYGSSPGSNGSQENVSEKVTKTAAQRRGSKQMRETIKYTHKPQDHVDELSTVGCSEMLDVSHVFEPTGHVTAHHCCASWSEGVTQNESYNLLCVDKAVHAGMSQRCHYCSRYGATIKCKAPKCERLFHYPCAAGSGCYQDIKSMSLLCADHLEQASTIADPDELNCAVCDSPGQISDLLFCTSCGHHYHGDCLDPHVDVNPVVRAGWQCPECKICQTCRQPGDDNKMLVCDVCDKGYHTFCLRPAMTFIPKNGWCCKICRRCTDCGSRTPGNGPSSRWHINYQVCDSCYQLRNKGSSCPVCSKAYRNVSSARLEMSQCSDCKKWVHWNCEEASHLEECQKQDENYKCPKCRNPELVQATGADTQPIAMETAPEEISEPQDLSITSLPVSEPSAEESTAGDVVIKTEFHKPSPTSPCLVSRKRASTSSSISSEKGNFALKGSSLDPMLCLGDASDPKLNSPPRKFRHISSDEALSARDRAERQSSAESNLSSLFTDENAQDAMCLFGVDTLPHSAPRSVPPVTPSVMMSPEMKTFKVDEGFVMPAQPKVTLSPLASPQSYVGSPPPKPPGPGIGKPGAMFGKGNPFGHKRKPRGKGGKGKGKGQKRGSFSGARKRPKGGKGSNAYTPIERNLPRRARRAGLQKQASGSPSIDEPLGSPVSKMEPVLQVAQADDEYGDSMHNTVVLCSAEDSFILCQDMCVVCGSFGKGPEGRLIACSQCGQCYHPYCVNLKLTKVVLRKGWRCLDCTVCEECGQVDDPAHLLLCDDCDISYHTHCLKPPLQHVPKGGWKCKWCVRCVHCGTTSPGKNCEWASNYTSCGPCASLNHCPRCRRSYKDEDVIMQCQTCDRWIHTVCEFLYTESDVEKVLEKGYDCVFCRPKDAIPPHLTLEPQPGDPNYKGQSDVYMGRTRSEVEAVKEYHKDCTALTIAGLQHIQKQMQKHMGSYKKRPAPARRGSRKPSENQDKMEPPPVLPTLEALKAKEPLGQPINVAAAVQALQDPSEVYRKLSEDSSGKGPMERFLSMQPQQLPVSTGVVEDLSSATATATEESGMEGIERDPTGMRPEDIKSPIGETDPSVPKPADFPVEPSIPDSAKAVLGIQQGGIKRRRKPYRPGIGGFMIRQRGRGGGLFKPRSRRTSAPVHKDSAEGSKTDGITTETASDAAPLAIPGQPVPTPEVSQDVTMTQPQSTPEGHQFTPPTGPGSIVSPIKLKLSSSSSTKRRKKKMKLIEQFPQYLQDAFFGKEVLTVAEHKATPFDNLNERPASPGSGYGSKQNNDSHLVLPDRLTQRLEMQAAVATASQRSAQRMQDEESMLMDRENEQELLGVLPDLPFKDDELIGMISSELKQEQGVADPHENILSPSSLEKMVSDGLDGLQNIGDVAALFSDVLNNQSDGSSKQDNLPHQHGEIHSGSQMDQTAQVTHSSLQETTNVHTGPQTSMHVQQTTAQQQIEQQRQLAIQQELQQIEMKQRQQQQLRQQQQQQHQRQHVIQRQMSVNIPPTGYGMAQQDQVLAGHHVINMGQGRVMPGQSVTPGPHGMTMVAQQHHVDPTRPHSHHTTPVMSPVPMVGQQQQTHPMAGMHHPSPHPTPPPQSLYARQASMPVLSHTAMPSPSATPDMLTGAQAHQQMQGQVNQNLMPQQVSQAKAMQRIQGHTATPSAPDSQGFTTATRPSTLFPEQSPMALKQTSTVAVPQPASHQAESMLQNQAQTLHRFHSVTEQLPQGQRTPLPSTEGYHMVPVEASGSQGSTHPTHKRSSSVPVAQAAPASLGLPPHGSEQAPLSTTPSSVSTQQTMPSSISTSTTAPTSEASDNRLTASQLPNFPSNQVFEPSPLPWPLGTDLENENPSVNQRNVLKWEKDEPLGELSTISPVLYANVKYPDLKKEFPEWQARAKQIAKIWRKASTDERAPFLQKAKDNRAVLKLSRARRGDLSKTPTPPIAPEEQESKAHQTSTEASRVEISDLALPGQSPASLGPLPQSQGLITTSSSVPTTISTAEEHTFIKPSSRTTTPKPLSPATGSSTQLPNEPALSVKQQPMSVPVSAYFAGQASESSKVETKEASQSPTKLIQAKIERRVSLDTPSQAVGPYPQSTPASSQDSPSKTLGAAAVTRSRSVGAAFADNTNTHTSLQTPPTDPKTRSLSVDSQVLQMQSTTEPDIKPNISTSPTPAQIRQVIYQQTTQRNSRRARLWEQSQPPPPYPSASPSSSQASQGFRYPQIGPRGQVMQIPGSGVGVLSPGGTQAIIRAPSPGLHNPGMIAFRFEGGQQQGGPPGHPMGQSHPGFPAGVHPVMKGFTGQHPPGAYIELRHTNQSDAATRRQNILRMTNVCIASPTPPQTQPTTVVSSPATTTETGQAVTQVKTEAPTPTTEAMPEAKAEDPFAGGHMPHDEHLDALLRSDEFKDLHFQRPTSTVLTDKTASKPAEVPTSESEDKLEKGTVESTNESEVLPDKELGKSDNVTVTEASHASATQAVVPTATHVAGPDVPAKDTTAQEKLDATTDKDKQSEPVEKSVADKVVSSEVTKDTSLSDKSTPDLEKEVTDKPTVEEDAQKELPVILKNDHCYSRSVDGGTESKTIEASEPATASVIKETLKAKSSLDIDMTSKHAGQDPRGVGLTPPPESQVGFIPAEVEKPDTALTVSNVITVPGTPPANVTPGKANMESPDKEISDTIDMASAHAKEAEDSVDDNSTLTGKMGATDSETELVSEKRKTEDPRKEVEMKLNLTKTSTTGSPLSAYDLPPLPKSPVAPPLVQKLSKFAKIPDPLPSKGSEEDASQMETESKEENKQAAESPEKSSNTVMRVLTREPEVVVPTSESGNLEMDVEVRCQEDSETGMKQKDKESESSSKQETPPEETEKDDKIDEKTIETVAVTQPAASSPERDQPVPMEVTESLAKKDDESQEGRKERTNGRKTDQNGETGASLTQATVGHMFTTLPASISPPLAQPPPMLFEQSATSTTQDTAPLSTISVCQTGTACIVTQPATASIQSLVTQSSEMPRSVSIVTVTQTPLATVTAYRQPVVTSTPTLNTASTVTVSAAHQVHPSIQQLPEQALTGQSHPVPPSTMAGSVTPTRPVGASPHFGVPAQLPQQAHISPSKDITKVTPPRQRPVLIKEQPLLLQDLMEQEKREQEKARREKMRHTQTLLQQQVAVQPPGLPASVYPMQGVEMEKVTPESGIDTIKMEFLSRMNQAAQAGLPVVPPPGPEGSLTAHGTAPMHPQQQTWGAQMPGAGLQQTGTTGFTNEAELRKYRNWLIQQQQLMQIQVPKQEQLVQAKKTRKQSLQKKKNQCKRNGKEFSAEDAEELKNVTKQYTEAQQQLEKLRNDQNQHAKLIQDFNIRQRHMLGSVSAGGQPGIVQQPQGQVAPGVDGQQQQIMLQHPGAAAVSAQHQQQAQQILVPQYQSPGLQQATPNVPQQQIMMMQQGPQQQLIIKSMPAASTNITGTPSTTVTSVAMGMQPQQTQVVVQTQQQKQAIMAQFHKMTGISPNSAQLQQIMINQQLVQQQQLQQQQQQTMKTSQQRVQFMTPQSGSTSQAPAPAFTATSNQTHNALMQMQMQQLMALQIEQQQNLAFQQQNPEKAKPKRRRRKKKSQAEKEEEERKQALAAQQQHQLQSPTHSAVPAPGQHPGTTWQHRPTAPPTAMSQVIQQQTSAHQQRFSHPGTLGQMQAGLPSTVVPGITPAPQTHPALSATAHLTSSVLQSPPTPVQIQPGAQTSIPLFPTATAVTPNLVSPAPTIMPSSTSEMQRTLSGKRASPLVATAATTIPSTGMTTVGLPSAPIAAPGTPQSMAPHSAAKLTSAITPGHITPTGTPGFQPQSTIYGSVPNTSVLKSPTPKDMSALPLPTTTHVPSVVTSPQQQMPAHGSGQKVTPLQSGTPVGTAGVPLTPQHMASAPGSVIIAASTPSRPPSGPLTPRTRSPGRSPGHAGGSFEGLSETEIAILMAHDPDLNQEFGSNAPAATTANLKSTVIPPPSSTPDQDDKLAGDESKKSFKRPKKGFVMDQKTITTIDDCIEKVIRLSADYEERLQMQAAKGQEGAKTPSPWELDPKPTKFPPKKTPETPSLAGKEVMKGMFGHSSMSYAPSHIHGLPSDVMAYGRMQPSLGMMPYSIKPTTTEDTSQKKKRSRRGSKEVGPDGKPIKRRRKKTKDAPQPQQQQQFQMGTMVDGSMQGMMMQTLQPTMQGGKPGVIAPMVQFPGSIVTSGALAVGQISPGQPGVSDLSKAVGQWKPLPLLRLIEPEIKKTHHMCVPKGTGLTECRNVLKGLLGEATYYGIPDIYSMLLGIEEETKKALSPPTPPSSQPSSPTRKQMSISVVAKSETLSEDIKTGRAMESDLRPSHSEMYGPLGLVPSEGTQHGIQRLHSPLVKIPESLPTPPHQGIEDKEDLTSSRINDDMLVPPSSPEMEDEDDWAENALAFLRNDEFPLILKTSPDFKPEKIRDSPSPKLPFMSCPKINFKGPPARPLNDKDSVSVTIEFDNANIKRIEKSLTLLSRILDTPIISYTMVEEIKPDNIFKSSLSQIVEEKQGAQMTIQTSQASEGVKGQPDDQMTASRQRRCMNCNMLVTGNGVRKPQFNVNYLTHEEDVIYCNKDCFIKKELIENKTQSTPTKKKFKASHIYQRQTQKISMAALLEQFPEEEPITPSKNTRSSTEAGFQVSGPGQDSKGVAARGRARRRGQGDEPKVSSKKWRGVKWKKWSATVAVVKSTTKPPVDVEAVLAKYGSALRAPPDSVDKRVCVFCGGRGDGDTHTIARLLNVDVDRWVHLNCALWSAEVYETQGGALINVDLALRRSESVLCCLCQKKGATIHCHRPRCVNTYHCQCALDIKCVFFKDKTVLCPTHAPKPGAHGTTGFNIHHSGDTLRSLAVFRKVYIQRPETKQIASIMQQGELTQGERNYVLRVGALIFENVGQLATHQMAACHTKTAIYPIGYKATRMYWSPTNMRRRCRYECSIQEVDGKPLFMMKYKAALPGKNKPDKIVTHADTVTSMEKTNVKELWMEILSPLEKLRSQHNVLKLFPTYIHGEKLFGLTTPVVSRILESLPNIELCAEYKFRYGRTPLLEVPLAINPTGCARSEPHIKQHRKKPHTLISNLISEYYESSGIGDASSLYGKQFVHSKSSQYRRMKSEWRSNVYLARSRIQGLGLFAARDIEPGTMVIEYIGDIIRTEVSEKREKMYEAANRGVYMFRLDSDHIVDATVTGGPARYINHSCKPNCVAEVVNFEKEKKIMIVSNRHILKGEELSYDYKFDFEDEGRKIPCLCGASNCKKWMN